MTCSLCEPIGDQQIANTGRGYYLGEPASSMTSLGPSHDDELRRCPSCGDLFHYTSEQAQTGSGNNDDDTITRLPAAASTAINAARDGTQPLPAIAILLAGIPRGVGRTHAAAVIPDANLRALVPHLLDRLVAGDDPWIGDLVRTVAAADAAYVKSELATRPDVVALAPIRAHARVVGCSICRGVRHYPPTPPPPGLKPLQISADHDLLDCPECDSLFEQNTRGVTRVYDGLVDAVRACVRRTGPVPTSALEVLFRYGQDWQTLIDDYARKYDRDLVDALQLFRSTRKK